MPRLGSSIAVVLLAGLACAPTAWALRDRPAPPVSAPRTPAPAFSSTDLIVQWADGADHGEKVEARDGAEVRFAADLGNREFQLVELEPGQSAPTALATLEADPTVAVAERDSYDTPNALPNDPLFGEQWALRNLGTGIAGFEGAITGDDIDAVAAWELTVGDPSVVVADIDTGYRFEHPDLQGVVWNNPGETPENGLDDDNDGIVDDVHGADFVGDDSEVEPLPVDGDPTDDDLVSGGHGVHTAGIIGAAGDNGVGISGVAQNVRIMPLRACARAPVEDEVLCPISSQIAAINYAAAKGARVANMSLGGNNFSQAEVNAIAAHPELLMVISAGNDDGDNDGGEPAPKGHHYPCDYRPQLDTSVPGAIDNVICVAATNQADQLAGFSDWGPVSVDLGAPGTEILSTYPVRSPVDESFELEDFASKWTATGADGGFVRTNEAPLTSFGMSDSPGASPTPNSVVESTSVPVSIPPGFEPCTLYQTRTTSLGPGGGYRYEVLLDGATVAERSPGSSAGRFQASLGDALAAGGEVSLRFRYSAGATPNANNGVWLDDIQLRCTEPIGQASGYTFLQGTSMAAPQVSGAAALLFSYRPTATVTDVRHELLGGVSPVASLAGKTASGGRLDVARSLEIPAAPLLEATDPGSPGEEATPRVRGSAELETTVDLYLGRRCEGSPVGSGDADELAATGIAPGLALGEGIEATFSATARNLSGYTSACSLPISYRRSVRTGTGSEASQPSEPHPPTPSAPAGGSPACVVPKLLGKTLARAKAALARAHCALGVVRRPRLRPGRRERLLVASSKPVAGASRPAGTRVALRFQARQKPRKHHR